MRTALLCAALALVGAAPAPRQPIHSVTNIDVLPANRVEGERILRRYVEEAKRDPDVAAVDLLRQTSTPNHFLLTQVMPDRSAYDRHVGRAYTRRFRAELYPNLGSPWDERLYDAASAP